MLAPSPQMDTLSFRTAAVQLLLVGVLAFGFAYGADWALARGLKLIGLEPHPPAVATPAQAPADDE